MVKWIGLSGDYSHSKISGIFVIRRKLATKRDKSNLLAHSALFCKTSVGFFIIEYFDDSIVYVSGPYQYDQRNSILSAQGHSWECQKELTKIDPTKTIDEVASMMEKVMNESSFCLCTGHISHKAQELTRQALGILNRSVTPADKLNITYAKAAFPN